jgi:hypothetical protein
VIDMIAELRSVADTGRCRGSTSESSARAAYLESNGLVRRIGRALWGRGCLLLTYELTREGREFVADADAVHPAADGGAK